MNEDKQPGISFDGIILTKEEFWRDYHIPKQLKIDLDIQMNYSSISNERYSTELITELKGISVENNKEVLKLKNVFVGFFSVIENEKNMDIKRFIENYSPALMFPYIREHIATITQKAGVKPILLPPINIQALIKNKNENGEI